MPILQSPRYSEILEKRSCMGEQMDLSPDFVKEILKEIHEESVRQQMIIERTIIYKMKILILGAGKMGSFFTDLLSLIMR